MPNPKKEKELKIIPLGGLGEVGRNMTLLEYERKVLIIDMGLGFPEENMPGIDFTIPNIRYLKGRKDDICGILLTHGHYDHIGAIPYLIKNLNSPPIFTSTLTKAIVLKRQEDFPNQPPLNIEEIKNGKRISLGPFVIEPFRQNHNIPETYGFFIKTPIGNIVHTSDFKFDSTPIYDPPTDFEKIKSFSKRGVLLLMSDSTGAEENGSSLSEKTIMENLEEIFKNAKKRIIASTFASHLNRIQQLIDLSQKYQRKVVLEGYSLKSNVEIARNLKYIKAKDSIFISPKRIPEFEDNQISFLCTGAQGEEEAIFMRIANKEYKHLKIKPGDFIIFSSSIVPGNERAVQYLKDSFFKQGAEVFHYKMMDIHASGHARKEELKKMIELTKPKFFMPVQGQYSMLVSHKKIAMECGLKEQNIVVAENGDIITLTPNKILLQKGKVPSSCVMVDGLGVGDVGEVVLRDRHLLSKDGIFVIITVVDKQEGRVKGSPDIISRGFVYLKESKGLLKETRKRTINIVNKAAGSSGAVNWTFVKEELKNKIGEFLFHRTKRRPMVLPVIIEV
jgi:ribonuclease J